MIMKILLTFVKPEFNTLLVDHSAKWCKFASNSQINGYRKNIKKNKYI